MHLTVQSLISHPLAGVFEVDVEPGTTVFQLIEQLCSSRQVSSVPSDLCICNLTHEPLPIHATLESQGLEDNDMIYLSHIREAEVPSPAVRWLYIAVSAMAIGLGGIIAITVLLLLKSTTVPIDYGIVLDAGSTHTEFFTYKWLGDKYNGTGCVHQVHSCLVKGGLANEPDPKEAGKSLLPCLNDSKKVVPAGSMASTPLYLGATAGLRLLNLSQPMKADLVVLSAKYSLTTGAPYQVKDVRIISGEEEAVAGWVTANFLTNTTTRRLNYTYGALDMGGASTQLAYESPSAPDNATSPVVQNVLLFGQNYSVTAYSFLCFGSGEAHRRHLANLVTHPLTNEEIVDPCMPKDLSMNFTAEYLFYHVCTNCSMWRNLSIPLDKQYTFRGSSQSQDCHQALDQLFQENYCRKTVGCELCFPVPEAVDTSLPYLAFSTYTYAYNFLNVTNSSLAAFIQATDTLCSMNWEEVKELPADIRYLSLYCFDAWYIHHVLVDKYGFTAATWPNILFQDRVGDVEVGWALGYMIQQTSWLPADPTQSTPLLAPSTYAILCFVLILVLCVGLGHCYLYVVTRPRRGYSTFSSPNNM